MILGLFATTAFAGVLGPGLVVPGANELSQGATVGVTGGGFIAGERLGPVFGVEAGYVEGPCAVGLAGAALVPSLAATFGARCLAVATPHFRLAVVGAAGGLGYSEARVGYVGFGAALDAGGEKFRFDVSYVPLGFAVDHDGPFIDKQSAALGLAAYELGVSWIPADGQRVRLGTGGGFGFTASYRYEASGWYAEADVSGYANLGGMLLFSGGVRF